MRFEAPVGKGAGEGEGKGSRHGVDQSPAPVCGVGSGQARMLRAMTWSDVQVEMAC